MEKNINSHIIENEENEKDIKFSFSLLNSIENDFTKFEEELNLKEIEQEIKSNDMNEGYFLSNYKKKEIEKLDKQIKQIISDIIEVNTDNIDIVIREILNKKRTSLLKKSWGNNNKKLLLYEIHRNYSSLIDKIYLFNQNDSLSFNENIPGRNTISLPNVHRLTKFNSANIVKKEKLEYFNVNGEEKNNKIKNDLFDFKKMEFKIIRNFFELSETQISGDSIRDWLYENSKY